MPRAAVSPGEECVECVVFATAATSPLTDVAGECGWAECDGAEWEAGVVGAVGVAIERRTTGSAAAEIGAAEPELLRPVAGPLIGPGEGPAEGPVVGALTERALAELAALAAAALEAAAAAARDRGVAAWRSAPHRPTGGLTADARPRAAIEAGVIAPVPDHPGAEPAAPEGWIVLPGVATFAVGAVDREAAAGMRRTTFAERSAALWLEAAGPGCGPAGPVWPARSPGARSPGARSPAARSRGARSRGARAVGGRFAGPRAAGAAAATRSRSTSIGPTEVISGGRRTRATSPPIRSAICPGPGPSEMPERTTRGKPRGGKTDNAGVAAGAAAASSEPREDHQYCHHLGGCTPCPTGRARTVSGPRSERRTSGECAFAAANRVAAIATDPIGDGRGRVSGGPGRRNRRATDWPRLPSPSSLICSRTRDE
jgi:hypothetical protein